MNVKQMAPTTSSNDEENNSDDQNYDNQKETILTDKRKVEQGTICGNQIVDNQREMYLQGNMLVALQESISDYMNNKDHLETSPTNTNRNVEQNNPSNQIVDNQLEVSLQEKKDQQDPINGNQNDQQNRKGEQKDHNKENMSLIYGKVETNHEASSGNQNVERPPTDGKVKMQQDTAIDNENVGNQQDSTPTYNNAKAQQEARSTGQNRDNQLETFPIDVKAKEKLAKEIISKDEKINPNATASAMVTMFQQNKSLTHGKLKTQHEASSSNKNNDNQQKSSPIEGKETTQQSTSIDNKNINSQQEISPTNIKAKSQQEARNTDQNGDNQLQTFLIDDKAKEKLAKEINSKDDKFNPSVTASTMVMMFQQDMSLTHGKVKSQHETSNGNKNNDNLQKSSPIDGKETTQQSTIIDNENIDNQYEISQQEARSTDQNGDNQPETFLIDVKAKEKLAKEIISKDEKFKPSMTAFKDQKHKSPMYNNNDNNSHWIRSCKGFLGALLAFLTCSSCYSYDVSSDSNDGSDAISITPCFCCYDQIQRKYIFDCR